MRHQLNRLLCCRKSDPCQPFSRQAVEPLERKRQVRSALVVRHRMNFVHNHGVDRPQDFAAPRGSQKNVERLRRGHQNMRWTRQHRSPFVRQRIAGPHRYANLRHQNAALPRQLKNLSQRRLQIFLNVVAERFQG
jgi:hypothetical protein